MNPIINKLKKIYNNTNNKTTKRRIESLILALVMSLTFASCTKNKANNSSDTQTISFNFELDDLKYNNYNYYLTSDEIDNIIKSFGSIQQCNFNFDGNIDIIIKNIQKNSSDYCNKYKSYNSAFNINLSNNNFETILRQVLEKIVDSSIDNTSEDMCKIKDLIIIIDNSNKDSADAIFDNNIIVLNLEQLYNSALQKGISIDEHLKSVIEHEINHARQSSCNCRINKGQLYEKIDYSKQNIEINKFIIEASAESIKYNLNQTNIKQHFDYTYTDEREFESLFFLIAMFDKKDLAKYYNSIYNSDLEQFYGFFGAYTKEQIKKLTDIIFAIDCYTGKNTFILEKSKTLQLDTYEKLYDYVGNEFKVNLFNTILQNLEKYTIKNSNFSLKENIATLCICHAQLEDIFNDKDINEGYLNSMEKYFEFLCFFYNTSIEEIKNTFNSSSKKIAENVKNIFSNDELSYPEFLLESEDIMERFPLLNSILFTNQRVYSYLLTDYCSSYQKVLK